MSTTSREEANRANAQHSTGPKSASGKAKVSGNRIIHNLTGERVLLPGESLDAYNELYETFRLEHDPQTQTETHLVEQLVHHAWRLNRVAEMEAEILAFMAGSETPNESPAAHAACHMIRNNRTPEDALDRLERYSASVRRSYNATLTQLRAAHNVRLREEKTKMSAAPRTMPAQPLENTNYDSNPTNPPTGFPADRKPPASAQPPASETAAHETPPVRDRFRE